MATALLFLFICGFMILPTVFAENQEQCLWYTIDGKCCSDLFTVNSITYSSCFLNWSPSFRGYKCVPKASSGLEKCMIKLPGIGNAYPFGMLSGALHLDQIIVPDSPPSNKVSTAGWKPSAEYLQLHTAALQCMEKYIQPPKHAVLSSPVFFQIDFIRPKLLRYLLLEETSTTDISGNRKFAIGIRDMNGMLLSLGDGPVYAKLFECVGALGPFLQKCRLQIDPVRALSIRIVPLNYIVFNDQLKWEIGGLDYIEADHHWRFDTVMKDSTKTYFPDERGNLTLSTTMDFTGTIYKGDDAGYFTKPKEGTSAELPVNHCLADPTFCKYGLSVAFSFKAITGTIDVFSSGQNTITVVKCASPEESAVGIRICWLYFNSMRFILTMPNAQYELSYTPSPGKLNQFGITWSLKSGLTVFVNGEKVASLTSPNRNGNFSNYPMKIIKVGTLGSGDRKAYIYNFRIWKFALSDDEMFKIHGLGSKWQNVRTTNLKKFRPKSCFDVNQLYPDATGSYQIFRSTGPVQLNCFKDVAYLYHGIGTTMVNGPLSSTPYELSMNYHMSKDQLSDIIDSSSTCSQKVYYKCKNAAITGKLQLYGRNGDVISQCQSPAVCNCDTVSATIKTDTQSFTVKSQLPITKVKVSGLDGITNQLHFTVGAVECSSAVSSASCEKKTIDGGCCVLPFTYNGASHTDCVDGNDSFGPFCGMGTSKKYCVTEETRIADTEISSTAKCVFPFKYKNKNNNKCISEDAIAPWCSLSATYTGKWRYCESQLPKADIDFSVTTSSDDYGDWKIGNNCDNEDSSGPCDDVTSSQNPVERSSTHQERIFMIEYSSLDGRTCTINKFQASTSGLSAIAFDLDDPSRPSILDKAQYKMTSVTGTGVYSANIYAVIPESEDSSEYISNCFYMNYQTEFRYGPVVWEFGPQGSGETILPDLKDIVSPVVKESGTSRNKRLFLVFEWTQPIIPESIEAVPAQFASMFAKSKVPDNYLFADAVDVKSPSMPLIYRTRYFTPTKKCLQFWFFMHNVGNKALIVSIFQKDFTAHQVMRIHGDQGGNWKKATIPLKGYLKQNGNVFYAIFTSVGESRITKSVAIDDISFLMEECALHPTDPRDLARNKQAMGNSNVPSFTQVVDGNPFTCSTPMSMSWLYVNLAGEYSVTSVRIVADEFPSSLRVKVGGSSDISAASLCRRNVNSIAQGEVVDIICSKPQKGSFVFLHFDSPSPVTICSMEVYSNTADNIPLPITLMPLDHSYYEYGSAEASTFEKPSSVKATTDKFGYSLIASYFDGNSRATISYSKNIEISADFTLCAHFKPVFLNDFRIFMLKGAKEDLVLSLLANGTVSLSLLTTGDSLVALNSPALFNTTQWKYICFVHDIHLGKINMFVDGVLVAEKDTGFAVPMITSNTVEIGQVISSAGASSGSSVGGYIACVQLYNSALDESVIKVLDFCPNRHVKDACSSRCQGLSVCNQITGKCVCPSHTNKFVDENCANVLRSSLYAGNVYYASLDYETDVPTKYISNFHLAMKKSSEGSSLQKFPFIYIPGPVNSAKCTWTPMPETKPISALSCFRSLLCTTGSTMSFWLLVPAVSNWDVTGNVTLWTYGRIKVVYGLVNDIRNGSTNRLPSLMFKYTSSSETCLWVSMIYSTLITDVWSHLAVIVDSSNDLKVFLNGKLNIAMKRKCFSPETDVLNLVTGSLNYTCMDELVVWNSILNANEIEEIYNKTVYGGQQAVAKHIAIRKMTMRGSDDLWAVDKSGIPYKYHDGNWISVPEERIRTIYAGPSGVMAVSQNNSLLQRNGISPQTPEGKSWNLIRLKVGFYGAINELASHEDGVLIAKSLYQWHCVNTLISEPLKEWKALVQEGVTGNIDTPQFVCKDGFNGIKGFCWNNGNGPSTGKLKAFKTKSLCRFKEEQSFVEPSLFTTPLVENIAFGRYQNYPFGIKKSGSAFLERIQGANNNEAFEKEHSELGMFADVAAINGLPYGIRDSGDILQIRTGEPFIIRSMEGKCIRKKSNGELTHDLCDHLFYFDEQNCLVFLFSEGKVHFPDSNAKVTADRTCNEEHVIYYHKDRTLRRKIEPDKCLGVNNEKLKEGRSCDSTNKFILETVSRIKKVYSYQITKNPEAIGNTDVRIEIQTQVLLSKLIWTPRFRNTNTPQVKLLCKKINSEFSQQYAGNINYGGVECGLFSRNCSGGSDCVFDTTVVLKLRYFGEEERIILFSRKFSGLWTDCQGFWCKFQITGKTSGVDFTPAVGVIENIMPRSAVLKIIPSYLNTLSILNGYNVSIEGRSKYSHNWITTIRIVHFKIGNIIQLDDLQPYFNYTVVVKPVFLQGTGVPTTIRFETLGVRPGVAPEISIRSKSRTSFAFTITGIKSIFWNGHPLGYRVYFQSLLSISSAIDFKNATEIERTHRYRNFTGDGWQNNELTELEVFTNYSILVCAYNSYGIGPMYQVFNRTMQGEPEVPPPDFHLNVINSTHIEATWSAMTTDIELLNGLVLSGYAVNLTEFSRPRLNISAPLTYTLATDKRNLVIGPLQEGREYRVLLAGRVEDRDGNFTSLCIRTEESVPTSTPKILEVINVTSDVVHLRTGCSILSEENGVITHYRVLATEINTGDEKYYNASITENVCLLQNRTCAAEANNCDFQKRNESTLYRKQFQKEHHCGTQLWKEISNTAFVVSYPADNLKYWTNYSINSALCTEKGCGPFGASISVRTDEHEPTCAPNVTSIYNTSSTSLSVTWIRTPVHCTHGILTHYNLYLSLDSDLSQTECFNASCWDLYSPDKNQTRFYITNITSLNREFIKLKKYKEYCVYLQAATIKGSGPASQKYCTYTAEDVPEGPPATINAKLFSSSALEVSLTQPHLDVVNGIIRGYDVFYYEADEEGSQVGPEKATRFLRSGNETVTTGIIDGLHMFTWYRLSAAAFTSLGVGPNGTSVNLTKTDEYFPTAPVRNISIADIRHNSTAVHFQQTLPRYLNGIFTKLYIQLIENLRNGTVNNYTSFALASSITAPTQNVTPLATNDHLGNGSLANDTELEPLRAWGFHQVRTVNPNATNTFQLNISANFFRLVFSGLLPFTRCDIYISSCTRIGCGPFGQATFQTDESSPSAAPIMHEHAVNRANSLKISWSELKIMDRNGEITGYKINYMKSCEYSRLHKLPEVDDCGRVIAEETKELLVQEQNNTNRNMTINGLTPFTVYYCEICAKTIKGYGPCSSKKYRTDEDVPSQAPAITTIIATYGTSVEVSWGSVPLPNQNGIIIGYQIRYHLTSAFNVTNDTLENYDHVNVTTWPLINKFELKGLELKSNYTVKIAAITSKGVGVFSDKYYGETGDYTHGKWTLWSQWSYCSASCGGGVSIRRRTCDNPAPFNGGSECTGDKKQTRECNKIICSGYHLGKPGETCTAACKAIGFYCNPDMVMDGTTTPLEKKGANCLDKTKATYSQVYHPTYVNGTNSCEGFRELPALFNCDASPPNDGKTQRLCDCVAPGDCGCTEWGTWSLCSVQKCGGGTQTRTRTCQSKPWCPAGDNAQRVECNTDPCPIDGNWGQWSEITPCNKSCGYGYRHRYRRCNNPQALYGGADCHGPSVYVIPECNIQKCPVHGNWGKWGEWRACDSPCGNGLRMRKRYCDNPAPRYLGNNCEGDDAEWKACNANPCDGVEILFTVRLTDFEWTYEYVYPTKPVTQKLTETCRSNVLAVYNNSNLVKKVEMLNFKQGSVIANFSVFYAEVKQGEILLLQDYVSTTGKLFNLSTEMKEVKPLQVVTDPPTNVTADSKNPFTMELRWIPPAKIDEIVNISGYYVFFREYDSPPGKWNVTGVPGLKTRNFTVRDLKAFTKYRFRMTLAVTTGNGPASNEVIATTKEGVPSVAPKGFSLLATDSSAVYLQWQLIPVEKYHGRRLGYRITYKPYFDKTSKVMTAASIYKEAAVTGLKAFTLYDFEIAAYTGAGLGPPSTGTLKTPEGAPMVPPPNVVAQQETSTSEIIVTWDKIPDDMTNGILLGYKLKYELTHTSDQEHVGAPITKTIALDKFTFYYKITGLRSYSRYIVSVSGYTAAGEGPYSTEIPSKTCKCPPNVFLNWYSSPPYVKNNQGQKMTGIMAELVESMIKSSCGKCAKTESKIYPYKSLSGQNPVKINEYGVKAAIGEEFHVSFPIFGYASLTRYMDTHVFILFIESAGSATIVRNEVDFAKKTINAFKSIGNIWPIILLNILFTGVFGIFIWFAERSGNDEFAQGYINGSLQGFWWAFISMTTVGYGDITPRTIKGRIVAIIWTLAGLVLSGILLGSLTSSVTSMSLPPEVTLYETTSAAINNSFEYNLGVRRNSKVNTKAQYQTTDEVLDAVKKKEVDIALIDAFSAASLQQKISAKSLKVTKVINAKTGYGVVLSKEFVRLEKDFRSFIASNQDKVASFTSNMTDKLELGEEKTEVPMLFDPSTDIFKEMLKAEGILLGVCSILGLLFSTYLTIKRKRAKIMSKQEMVLKEMEAFDLSVSSFEKTLNGKVEFLGKKHKTELDELLRLKKSYERLLHRRYQGNGAQKNGKKFTPLNENIGQSET